MEIKSLKSLDQISLFFRRGTNRFYTEIIICFIITGIAICGIEFDKIVNASVVTKSLIALILGLGFCTAITLGSEKFGLKTSYSFILKFILFVCLGLYYYLYLPVDIKDFDQIGSIRYFLLCLISYLSPIYISFIKDSDQKNIWNFNLKALINLGITIFMCLTLYAGIAILLLALKYLFEIPIEGRFYGEAYMFIFGVFGSLVFYSLVPKNFIDENENYVLSKHLKLFSQYILLFLLIIYTLVLYAYIFKIFFTGNWPKDGVVWLIIWYSIIGIAMNLFLQPYLENPDYKWIKKLSNVYFAILIPIIGIYFFALFIRIGEYGITFNRYFTIVFGLWILVYIIYKLSKKDSYIIFVPISISIFIVFTALGPQSVFSITKQNQLSFLEKKLTQNNILINGKITKHPEKIDPKTADKIKGSFNYIISTFGTGSIYPWFPDDLKEQLKNKTIGGRYYSPTTDTIINYIGIETTNDSDRMATYDNLGTESSTGSLDISGYDYMKVFDVNNYGTEKTSIILGDKKFFIYQLKKNEDKLIIGDEQGNNIEFDFSLIIKDVIEKYGKSNNSSEIPPANLSIEKTLNGYKLKIYLTKVYYGHEYDSKINHINSIYGVILLGNN